MIYFLLIAFLISPTVFCQFSNSSHNDSSLVNVENWPDGKLLTRKLEGGKVITFVRVLDNSSALDFFRVAIDIPKTKQFKDTDSPVLLLSASNGRDAVHLSLPVIFRNGSSFYSDGRIVEALLPSDFDDRGNATTQKFIITVQSRLNIKIEFNLHLTHLDRSQYDIKFKKSDSVVVPNQSLNFVKPLAFRINTKDVQSIMLRVNSSDNLCATLVAIENERSLHDSWMQERQTEKNRLISFSRRADIYFPPSEINSLSVITIFVFVNPDESACQTSVTGNRTVIKNKKLSLEFTRTDTQSFTVPVSTTIGVFFLPLTLVLAIAISRTYKSIVQSAQRREIHNQRNLISFNDSGEHHHVDYYEQSGDIDLNQQHEPNYDEIGTHEDGKKRVYGDWKLKSYPVVVILPFFLHTAVEFYKWHTTIVNNRDDMCFHNFACAKPHGELLSFNHIISNVGYLICGLQFIAITCIRKKKLFVINGIHPTFGLDICLGIFLILQSFASATYHVCPSNVTFQFDTPFIQILCALVIYRQRCVRRQVPSADVANLLVAAVLALNFIVSFCDVYSWVTAFLGFLQTIFVVLTGIFCHREMVALSTMKKKFFVFYAAVLGLTNFFLISMYLTTSYFIHLNQIGTFVFVTNTILYLAYYLFSKVVVHKEAMTKTTMIAGVLGTVFWVMALGFFVNDETDWTLSAASSRALNRDCVLLDFFDSHDVWHMTSAFAIFFSLLFVSSLDDVQMTATSLPVF